LNKAFLPKITIEDDTKAAARRSPDCIGKQKQNTAKTMIFFHPATWHDDMSLNSPGSSTLQCDTWLCNHDVEFANVCHIRILLVVSMSNISPQSTCHSAPVC